MPNENDVNKAQSVKDIDKYGLKLDRVQYRYPGEDRFIIDGISLNIGDKEKVGIIGSTAAGKTTLSQILAGILKPESGTIAIDHYDYNLLNKCILW